MNFPFQNNIRLRLTARNEGKLKSYRSCTDFRAWSHDVSLQGRYLREWMKCDMPVCVIPLGALSDFLRTMTCRSRRRVPPRCHPDCKSKILLESICNSCHAMRDCLKQDDGLEKYFVEEELETSHWPCDRCLDALKSIKMFWKVLINKLFNIDIAKFKDFQPTNCDSVKSIAKIWQGEMLQQAVFVKNVSSTLSKPSFNTSNTKINTYRTSPRPIKYPPTAMSKHIGRSKSVTQPLIKPKDERSNRSKALSTELKTIDAPCDTCFIEKENEELDAFKKNIKVLQEKYNLRTEEVERLTKENTSLKIELENFYNGSPWKAAFYRPKGVDDYSNTSNLVPKPFENTLEEKGVHPVKNVDSEMIITLKNCKNENFKHVSVLKVLHKSNEPIKENLICCGHSATRKEDPIELLTKVHNKFGAIVKREIDIVNEKKLRPKTTTNETLIHKISSSTSAPSCSTISSSSSSDTHCTSSKDGTLTKCSKRGK